MPDRSRKKKTDNDPNLLAKRIVDETTESKAEPSDDERREAARILGRLGGLKGGPARAKKLSPKKRSEIAKRAAKARWKDKEKSN